MPNHIGKLCKKLRPKIALTMAEDSKLGEVQGKKGG